MDRVALAEFLRARRERLQPDEVGLSAGPRRRARGLRREDVAALAGMSTDYYARMEQQRGPQPSEQMVAALARALRLTLDERDHLFRLCDHHAPTRVRRTDHVSPALSRVLDLLTDTPALVVSDVGDTLAQNHLAAVLFGEHHSSDLGRSAYYRWFTDPAERRRYPQRDHDHQGVVQVAALRAALGAAGRGDDRPRRIVDELLATSDEFARLWARQDVAQRFDERKTLVHPSVGEIEVACQTLHSENRAQTLLVITAAPGTEAHEKLRLLRVLGSETFTATP